MAWQRVAGYAQVEGEGEGPGIVVVVGIYSLFFEPCLPACASALDQPCI